MKLLLIASAASLLLYSCSNEKTDSATKTDKDTTTAKNNEPVNMPDSATMMKMWAEYMTPGEMHKMMAKDVGTWDADITMWMDPSKPPTKSKASSVVKMIYNGLYQVSENKGNFDGMPFEGTSTLGYNNLTKKFENTWVDNMGSGIVFLSGTYDSTTKTLSLAGTSMNPMTGKECNMRQVLKYIDDNTQVLEMFDNSYGSERKSMELKSVRRR